MTDPEPTALWPQVQDTIIAAYSVSELLGAYVAGTRDWLYADITHWLEGATDAAATSASRMFLLLAGPGMGKSVFSAVVYNNLTARTRRDKFVMVRAAGVAALVCDQCCSAGSGLQAFIQTQNNVIHK
jgi:hypothetical protein